LLLLGKLEYLKERNSLLICEKKATLIRVASLFT